MLSALVKQRLTAAAEEIFGLFERTIAEYEEQLYLLHEAQRSQRHTAGWYTFYSHCCLCDMACVGTEQAFDKLLFML